MAHIAIADGFSTALCQTGTGNGVAFELPSNASASKWKRFVTTWLTVFPVLLIINLAVRTALKDAPLQLQLQLLPSSLMLTATLQWLRCRDEVRFYRAACVHLERDDVKLHHILNF